MKQFEFTYFCGPDKEHLLQTEIMRDIADAGITLVPVSAGDAESNREAILLADSFGMRSLVSDPRISECLYHPDADVDRLCRLAAEDYRELPGFTGFDITDEPNASAFPRLAEIVSALNRYAPGKETVINLFPNYASAEQLGNPDYRTHVSEFLKTVKPGLLSYDHYHFLGRENRKKTNTDCADERERLIRLSAEETADRGGFFENIEVIRAFGIEYETAPMMIALLTEHGPYRNLTRAELLWEANVCLAYGMKRISYFTYWEPGPDAFWQWTNAMCNRDGVRMPHWYDVREITKALKPVGELLFSRRSLGVRTIGKGENGTLPLSENDAFPQIKGECGLLGAFTDGIYYLVNRDYIGNGCFLLPEDGFERFLAETGEWKTCESRELLLGAGEGVALRKK